MTFDLLPIVSAKVGAGLATIGVCVSDSWNQTRTAVLLGWALVVSSTSMVLDFQRQPGHTLHPGTAEKTPLPQVREHVGVRLCECRLHSLLIGKCMEGAQ